MSQLKYPDCLYLFSDTYGGHETWDPLKSPDVDARIATDIRSCITGVRREFDIFGEESITDHVLRTVVKLHDENGGDRIAGTTGVFINHAPRTTQHQNGNPFYLAEIGKQIRVVTTPVSVLSSIKERVAALYHLPEDNELYKILEQFRSSYAVVLLATNHGLKLVRDDPKTVIPDYPSGCRLAYVDRFGNLVLYEHSANEEVDGIREVIRKNTNEIYQVGIGRVRRNLTIGTSLAEAKPESLVVYPNDGHIEVVTKWHSTWTAKEKLKHSAFEKFRRPQIGALASVKSFYECPL